MSRIEKYKQQKAANKLKLKKPWLYTLIGAGVLLLAVLIFAGYQLLGTYNALDSLNQPKENIPIGHHEEDETMKPNEWNGTERVNILLLGGDNRGVQQGDKARSDSMLVLSLDPATKKIHLLSVLRDSYIPIEGYGDRKANEALALGGPNLAMRTIGNMLGLDIQYYVYTDFEGFKSLIDAIGGIDFYVEKNMKYTDNADGNRYDINLQKGQQLLNGDMALQYVRFRHDKLSDFTRTERQRNLLSAVADKLKSGWSLLQMKEITESIAPYIQSNLEPSDMLELAKLGIQSQMAGSLQVPPMNMISDQRVGQQAVLMISNADKLREFVAEALTSASSGTMEDQGSDGGSISVNSGKAEGP
ncbi:LCP family protein [Paenibacillus sp. GCM10027626]|uniref:LCP family protein n=1 Tax=Paenibacillus sp. GCM10027626 TaxID=3273411 RepID=UPI00362C16DA